MSDWDWRDWLEACRMSSHSARMDELCDAVKALAGLVHDIDYPYYSVSKDERIAKVLRPIVEGPAKTRKT